MHDESLCAEDEVEVVLQVNNKVRSKILVPATWSDDDVMAAAQRDEKLKTFLAGKTIVKSFVVANRNGKLVNFVIKG